MSVTITIKGTPIDFPSSGESPNWSPAVIEFAQAVEQALNAVVGPYDVPSQVFTIVSDNSTISINGLAFPTSVVRAAYIKYAVILNGTSTTSEVGNMMAVYDGAAWTLSRDYVGDSGCVFSISSGGQVDVAVPTVPGFVSGRISFSGQALQQNP